MRVLVGRMPLAVERPRLRGMAGGALDLRKIQKLISKATVKYLQSLAFN